MTTILMLINLYKLNFQYNFNFINKLFTVITINRSPFKGGYFGILLLIGIITTLIVRLDYIINLLNNLPYELMISLRLSSALYSILSLFLLMIIFKHCKELIIKYYNSYKLENNIKLDNWILIIYLIYFTYILVVNIILFYINYYSILSLNIEYLDIIFLILSIISLIIGIYYSIYKFNVNIDLNKTLSFTGKITLFGIIIIYAGIFIGIRTGIILEWLSKFELIETIHCESNNPTNLNSRLRNGEDGTISTISNNNGSNIGNTRSSINSSINIGDSTTLTNVSINPNSNNTASITTSRTVSTTTAIISPTNNSSSELNPPVYPRNNNNSLPLTLINKGKEALGIFNKGLKNNSLQISTSSTISSSSLIIDTNSVDQQFENELLNQKTNAELNNKNYKIEDINKIFDILNNSSAPLSQEIIYKFLNLKNEDKILEFNPLGYFEIKKNIDLDEILNNNNDLLYISDKLDNIQLLRNDSHYNYINYIFKYIIKPYLITETDKIFGEKIFIKLKKDSFWKIYLYIYKNYYDNNINVNHVLKYLQLLINTSIEQYSSNKFLLDYDLDECLNLHLHLQDKHKLIYLNSYYSYLYILTKNNDIITKYKDFEGLNNYKLVNSISKILQNERNPIKKELFSQIEEEILILFKSLYGFEFKKSLESNYLQDLTIETIKNNRFYHIIYDKNNQINRLIFFKDLGYFAYFSKDENQFYNFEIIHCDSVYKLRHFIKLEEVRLFNKFKNICNEENIEFIVRDLIDKKLDINYINKLILNKELYNDNIEKLKYIKEIYIKLTNIQNELQNFILGLNTDLPENNQQNLIK